MTKLEIEQIERWLRDSTPQTREESQARTFILRCLIRWRNMNAAVRWGLNGLDNPKAA